MGDRVEVIELGDMGEENGTGSKWRKAALIMDAVGRSLRETAGSAMNVVMKLVVFLGYLAIQRMLPDGRRGLDWGHHLRLLHSGRSAVFGL